MYKIEPLKKRLSGEVNIRAIATLSGVSEKTVHRIKNGEADNTTLDTANKILSALEMIYPARKKPIHGAPAQSAAATPK